MATNEGEPTSSDASSGDGGQRAKLEGIQRYWLREIGRYEKQFQKWTASGEKIMKLYRRQEELKTQRKFAMLWANTDVLKPAVYARVPVPIVGRRFKDKDPVSLFASEILERNLSYEIETADFHEKMEMCRDDMLLPGRGSMWVRLEDKGDGYKCLKWDFVHWKDYGHSVARTWPEVTAVWRKVYMTKREMANRFFNGDMQSEDLRQVELDHRSESQSSEDQITAGQSKATVYEIWDKKSKQIYFIARGGQLPLEVAPPFLDLKSFWPCPKPLYATVSTESLEPTPDYKYYQDQAEEIDVLTARIASLSDSLKLVGFYPAGENESDIAQALSPQTENKMIAVENWAAFAEKGGTSGITFLPIKEVAEVIVQCINLRNQLVQDVFQIMGLSDIQRGASNPEETLGAQQLKAQYGSNRLKSKRDEIQRFAQEALEIGAEIIAEHFDPQQVLAVANRQEADQQIAQAAFALLRDDHLRCFRIDIETDSTIYPDEQAEKEARNEFLVAISQFMQQMAPMIQTVPVAMPLAREMLLFAVRGYRVGRELEGVIDQTMEQMQQQLQAQQEQGNQDPEKMAKIQNESRRIDIEADKVEKEHALKTKELQLKAMEARGQAQMAQDQMDLSVAQAAEQQKMSKEQFAREGDQQQFERSLQDPQGVVAAAYQQDPMQNPMAQGLMQMAQAIQALTETVAQQNAQIMQIVSAPKKSVIERDPLTGDVTGATQVTLQ